jgi:transcriptional regulator with XRE-family HTH domain
VVPEAETCTDPLAGVLEADPIVNVLHAARLARGWSYRQLSEASGVSAGYICEMEKGAHSPALRHLRRLAKALDIELRATLKAEEATDAAPQGRITMGPR